MHTALMLIPSADDAYAISAGLLAARLVLGALLAAHGAQKLFGWFGGYGLAGTAGYLEQLGFRPGRRFAVLAGVAELASGTLVALGLLGAVGPAMIVAVMLVAAVSVHWRHGVFAVANGVEVPLLYAAGAVALAFTGPGLFSLDAVLATATVWTPALVTGALAAGVVGGLANLAVRRPAAAATRATAAV